MSDLWDGICRDAAEYCGSRVTAPEYYGLPIVVSLLEKTSKRVLVYPPCFIRAGMPVVELVVRLDGVLVTAGRHRVPDVFSEHLCPFPTVWGFPILAGRYGEQWRESVDVELLAAVESLPRMAALAGP